MGRIWGGGEDKIIQVECPVQWMTHNCHRLNTWVQIHDLICRCDAGLSVCLCAMGIECLCVGRDVFVGVCMCAVRLYGGHTCSCMCSMCHFPGSTELPIFKTSPGDPLLDSFQWPSCLKLYIFIYCKKKPHLKHKNKELDTGKNNVS